MVNLGQRYTKRVRICPKGVKTGGRDLGRPPVGG